MSEGQGDKTSMDVEDSDAPPTSTSVDDQNIQAKDGNKMNDKDGDDDSNNMEKDTSPPTETALTGPESERNVNGSSSNRSRSNDNSALIEPSKETPELGDSNDHNDNDKNNDKNSDMNIADTNDDDDNDKDNDNDNDNDNVDTNDGDDVDDGGDGNEDHGETDETTVPPNGFFHFRGKLAKDYESHCAEAKKAKKIWVDARVDEIPEGLCMDSKHLKEVKFDMQNSQLETIGKSAFARTKISTIEIPSSVKEIPERAFQVCKDLKEVKFDMQNSQLETIGKSAFNGTKISTIEIPSLVKEIAQSAFRGCNNLTEVKFDMQNSQLETIGKSAFNSTKISTIEIPSLVKEIAESAFQFCDNLTEVKFDMQNSQLETIGKFAFIALNGTKISTIEIPSSVKEIAEGAFQCCDNLTEVKFDMQNSQLETIGESVFAGTKISTIEIPSSVKEIAESAFRYCDNLTEVKFDMQNSQLETIGKSAFTCTKISTIEIPSSVKEIAESAFQCCEDLKEVKFDKKNSMLKTISRRSFAETAISTINIPSSVNAIEDHAFWDCTSLTRVCFDLENSQLRIIDEQAFADCHQLRLPNLPKSLKEINPTAFNGCCFATPFVYLEKAQKLCHECEKKVEEIDEKRTEIFYSEYSESVEEDKKKLEEKLKNLKEEYGKIFKDIVGILSVTVTDIIVPASMTHLFSDVFGNAKLKYIHLPSTLKKIGNDVFCNQRDLKYIKIPDSVEEIGNEAFGSSGIEVVVFGRESKLKKVSDFMFGDKGEEEIYPLIQLPPGVIIDKGYRDTDFQIPKLSNMHSLAYWGSPPKTSHSTLLQSMESALLKDPEALKATPWIFKNDERITEMTALHIYLKCGHSDLEVIEWMINEYPESILIRDAFGNYPIHYFCKTRNMGSFKNDLTIVQLLVQKSKGAVLVHDSDGIAPFAHAIDKLSWPALEYLYSVEPVTPYGNTQKAISYLKEKYLKKMLGLESQPQSLDKFSSDKQNGWVKFVSSHIDPGSSEETNLVDMITERTGRCSKQTVQAFAWAKTADDRSAMEVAVPKIKTALQERLLFLKRYDINSSYVIHKSPTCIVVEAKDAKTSKYYEDLFYDQCGDGQMDEQKFEVFLRKHSFVMEGKAGDLDKAEVSRYLAKVDLDKSGSISKNEFVSFCNEELGDKVVLKLMKNEDQFKREIESRNRLKSNSTCVISILRFHTPHDDGLRTFTNKLSSSNTIPNTVDVNDLPEFFGKFFSNVDKKTRQASRDDTEAAAIAKDYKYILVMSKGDRNLDSIFRSERPEVNSIRAMMREVVHALTSLHAQGIIHGDLKMLNIVREAHTHRLKLIDLDAAARVSDSESKYITSKFSSGILAPEIIHFLPKDVATKELKKQFEELEKETEKRVALWDKRGENGFVIKNVLKKKSIRDLLDIQPIKASEKLDVWAFGALLYCLCTGRTLFDVNRDDDIDSFDIMKQLYAWNKFKSEKLQRVTDNDARALLYWILEEDPAKRPSMEEISNDVFFDPSKKIDNTAIFDILSSIDNKIDGMAETLKKIDSNLEKANNRLSRILDGEKSPRLIYIVPIEQEAKASWWNSLKDFATERKVMICFVCPITYKIPQDADGKLQGYEKNIPADWIKMWGPRILMTLKVTQFALSVGRMAGLPMPKLDVGDTVKSVIEDLSVVTELMSGILKDDSMKKFVDGSDISNLVSGETSVDEFLDNRISNTIDDVEGTLSNDIPHEKQELIEASSKEVEQIGGKDNFEQSGLILVEGDDGSSAFVHPDAESFYKKYGSKAFDMCPQDDRLKEVQDLAKKEQDLAEEQDRAKKVQEKFNSELQQLKDEQKAEIEELNRKLSAQRCFCGIM